MFGEVDDKILIMDAGEDTSSEFMGVKEMGEVGFAVVLAGIAIAFGIYWRKIMAIFGVFDVNAAVAGVESAVPCLSCWGDAIKSVAAEFGTDKEVTGFGAHTEEVAGAAARQNLIDELEHCVHTVSGEDAADTESVKNLAAYFHFG